MSNIPKVTICVPTLNRPEFLLRLLRYYARAKFPHSIFIGDSSESECMEENKKNVKSFEKKLNIRHFECLGLSVVGALESFSHLIETPYAAFVSDDDFLCPAGLKKAIHFLDNHSDYVAAHGVGGILGVYQGGAYGHISVVSPLQQCVLTGNTGKQRLNQLYTEQMHALIYSTHRIEVWKEMWKDFSESRQGFIFDEHFPNTISAIRGKVKEIDGLYLIRQMHPNQYTQMPFFDWITDSDWLPAYNRLKQIAIQELIQEDGMDISEAESAFKTAFEIYFEKVAGSHCLKISKNRTDHFFGKFKKSLVQTIKKQLSESTYHRIRKEYSMFQSYLSSIPIKKEEIHLANLLSPRSPYHYEFKPIYDLIQGE